MRVSGGFGRVAAVLALVALPASTFVAERGTADWIADLRCDDAFRRRLAAHALREPTGGDARRALSALLTATLDRDRSVARAARASVLALAPRQIRVVVAGASTTEPRKEEMRSLCVRVLLAHPDLALPALVHTIRSPHAVGREQLAQVLAQFGREAVPAALELTASPDARTRHLGVVAFGRIGPAASDRSRSLSASLQDESPSVRRAAMDALASVAPTNSETLQAARMLADDPDPGVRRAAARAMATVASAWLDLGTAEREDEARAVLNEARAVLQAVGESGD